MSKCPKLFSILPYKKFVTITGLRGENIEETGGSRGKGKSKAKKCRQEVVKEEGLRRQRDGKGFRFHLFSSRGKNVMLFKKEYVLLNYTKRISNK